MRLVHLTDLHLGFRGFPGVERESSNVRESDLARAFRLAIREIVRLGPELILITGDVFDYPDPPSSAVLTLFRGLRLLRSKLPQAPVLVIAGARDTPRNPGIPGPVSVLDTLPGIEAAAGAPRAVRFADTGLHALLVPHRAAVRPPFPELGPDPNARWNVLLVRGDPESGGRGMEVDPAAWDYVAVGGPHRSRAWRPNVRTPGSLERPGPDPWSRATEERGFLSFDFATGEAELHPVAGRPVVDLAPIRITPEDREAGTRRFRELLEGVPGGVDGKLVRARFEGDVLTPDEGVSPGLLGAVRRRATHLEIRLSGGRADPAGRPEGPEELPTAIELLDRGGEVRATHPLGRGIVLVTAATDELRARVSADLRESGATPSGEAPHPRWRIRLAAPPPAGRGLSWMGRDDWGDFIADWLDEARRAGVVGAATQAAERVADGPVAGDSIETREVALQSLRADAVEASGDLEAKALEWARERQDAESHLHAYRSRALELRKRLRTLEEQGEASACPTCGRTLGADLPQLLRALREEWDSVVQDGQWWARRREQLEEKPEELRRMEETALRLHAGVEEEAEALEGLRERARHRPPGDGASQRRDLLGDRSAVGRLDRWGPARDLLRRTGSLVGLITEGRTLGVRVGPKEELRVVGPTGEEREPEGGESASILGALHLAHWIAERERLGPGRGLLLWELHAAGAAELATHAVEILGALETEDDLVVAVVPPAVLERVPEGYSVALELTEEEAGRSGLRRYESGTPALTIRPA